MALRFTDLGRGLLLVTSRSKTELGLTFLRPQEFYESQNPSFRTTEFSMEEFRCWYRARNGGRFTYCTDWTGFNLPEWHLDRFRKTFRRLSLREKRLLRAVDRYRAQYVIGTFGKDRSVLQHEIAHALYGASATYRSRVREIMLLLSRNERFMLHHTLRDMGYAEDVIDDESQAYLLFCIEDLRGHGMRDDQGNFPHVSGLLRRVYDEFTTAFGWRVM